MKKKVILSIYVIGIILLFLVLCDTCNEQKGTVLSIVPLMIGATWGTTYLILRKK